MKLESIAKYYAKWIVIEPFDGGMSTGLALRPLRKTPSATAAITNAFINNQSSQSNGSLIRITFVAVWASSLKNPFNLCRVIVADSKMTHPNKIVHACISLYCQIIHHLLLDNTILKMKHETLAAQFQDERKGVSCNTQGIIIDSGG